MSYVFSVAFWLVFLVTSPFAFLGAVLLAAATARSDPRRNLLHAYVSRYMFGLLKLNPLWDVRVDGREKLPSTPCVIAANHQSMADILAAFGLLHPFKFVSKASLFRVPLVGWAMRLCRYVPLERGRPRSTRQMLDTCRGWLRAGVSVLIFPEGTYSTGGKMLPFRRGAFVLAVEERVPIVPVRIEGTSDLIDGDGPWLQPRATVRVRVLDPIADVGLDEAALSRRVRVALGGGEEDGGVALLAEE